MKKVMILSGGFDPLHSGHIDMFRKAREICDYLVVCINSDEWLVKKKGINFLNENERLGIINSIKYVNESFIFEDDEHGSAINGIKKVIEARESYGVMLADVTYLTDGEIYSVEESEIQFVFGNGGDRNPNSTPSLEQTFCEENGIELVWNLGGDKSNSSSWILNRYRDWHFESTERVWGHYKVIYQDVNKKVKLIVLNPKSSISLQKHNHRSEHWVVVEGTATAIIQTDKCKTEQIVSHNESVFVPVGAIHQLKNEQLTELKIIEVQIGDYVGEDDIIRYS